MIQRIQSGYLLLTIIMSGLFLKVKFLVLTDNAGSETVFSASGIFEKISGSGNALINRMIPVASIALLIPLIALVVIFLYKKRRLQLRLAVLLLILELLLILAGVAYAVNIFGTNSYTVIFPIGSLIPFVEIILTFLAYRGIKHDEELVRSYDRLR